MTYENKLVYEVAETAIRDLLAQGRHHDAVEVAVKSYGREIAGFILAMTRDAVLAADVQQDVWQAALEHARAFRGDSSFKAWVCTVARNAARRAAAGMGKRAARAVPLSQASESRLAADLASSVSEWRKDDVKARLRAIRERLKEEDQALLYMRADLELPFSDIARSTLEPGEMLDQKELAKRVNTLTVRFKRLKQWLLREMQRLAEVASDPQPGALNPAPRGK